MESCRVVLANQPRLLRGLLSRVLAKAPGVEVVSEELDLAKLSATVKQENADWVIVSLWQDGEMPRPLEQLLARHPTTCLLGMAADGSQARVRCSTMDNTDLDGLSLQDLFATLRKKDR
jgi:DNA-binding NarL/FixJ family response regulator